MSEDLVAEIRGRIAESELIKPRGPWRTVDQVEIATAEWVDWFNNRRMYEYRGDIPPVELEAAYYAQNGPSTSWSPQTNRVSGHAGAFIGGVVLGWVVGFSTAIQVPGATPATHATPRQGSPRPQVTRPVVRRCRGPGRGCAG